MKRQTLFRLKIYLLLSVSLFFARSIFADELVMISNYNVKMASIPRSFIVDMFVGKMEYWNSSLKIKPAYLKNGRGGDYLFSKVLKMTPQKFFKKNKEKVYSGNGVGAREFSDLESLVNYVRTTKGAMAVVYRSQIKSIGNLTAVPIK